LVARINHARDEEYEELADTAERLVEEIARETRKGKFTFAALEEVEGELERLERWRARVQARDAFDAPLRAPAEHMLGQARAALETFAAVVQQREEMPNAASDVGTGSGPPH
jgi:hypothetical protein